MVEAVITVTGMSCDHCVRAVTEELGQLPGVRDVDVDLTSGRVRIVSDAPIDADAVRAAIEDAGYAVAP